MEVGLPMTGPGPPIGFGQGPSSMGLTLPPGPLQPPNGSLSDIDPGFLLEALPTGPGSSPSAGQPGLAPPSNLGLGLAPPSLGPPSLVLGAGLPPDLPPGLPPGFPPMGSLPPGLPPGFPPGFAPSLGSFPGDQVAPGFGLGGPPGFAPVQGPGRPGDEAVPLMPIGIGPPPSTPPPSRPPMNSGYLDMLSDFASRVDGGAGSSDAGKKRKRGVDGLASNKSIQQGGSVTIYSGYEAVTGSFGPAAKAAPAVNQLSASSSAPSSIQGHQALPRQLPEGWEMKKSRTTGKVYYVNEKLGKSQFEPPMGSTVKAVPQKKKQKASTRPKDLPDAQVTSMNGVMGVVRATDQNTARWQKWQKCSRIVNAPSPEKDE